MIFSNHDSSGVPFALVQIVSGNRHYIFESDKNGLVDIRYSTYSPNDSIFISNISYQDEKLRIQEIIDQQKLYIKPKIYEVKEVVVTPPKLEYEKLGNPKKKSIFSDQLGFNQQSALFISTKNRSGKLEKIRVYMQNSGEKGWKYRPFRLRLYKGRVLGEQLIIEKELITDELIASLKSRYGNWVVVDISRYKLELPETGLVVAIQALPYEYYKKNGFIKTKTVDDNLYGIINSIAIGFTNKVRNREDIQPWEYFNETTGWTQEFNHGKHYYMIQAVVSKENTSK